MFELPISEDTIRSIAAKNKETSNFSYVDILSFPELVSLLVVQKLGSLQPTQLPMDNLSGILENQITELLSLPRKIESLELRQLVKTSLNIEKLYEGCRRLKKRSCGFMLAEQVGLREYLHVDGSWNPDYKIAYHSQLYSNEYTHSFAPPNALFTRDQNRILNIFMSEPDESLDVQGFAGTGKTKLISLLVDSLNSSRVLLLAMSWPQLEAMSKRLNKTVDMRTFGQLADETRKSNLLNQHKIENFRTGRVYEKTAGDIAQIMSYHDLDGMQATYIAQLVNQIVIVFCHSSDAEITDKHIPKNYRPFLQESSKPIIIKLAREYWDELIYNRNNSNLPAKAYHRVKLWSLSPGVLVPLKYTHIIIDETHDLPAPVINVLDNSSQSVITFGDNYQVLERSRSSHKREAKIRHKTMSTSYRAGSNTNNLYNSIVLNHPQQPEQIFEGAENRTTEIIYFEGDYQPADFSHYCTILAKNSWHIFKLLLQLSKANATFHVFHRTLDDMKWLVQSAIEFYKYDEKPRHRDFFRHTTWESYLSAQPADVVEIIENTILREVGYKELESAIEKQMPTPDSDHMYILGKIEDAKNMEFDRVVILRDALDIKGRSAEEFGLVLNYLYTGISRAKHQIYIPAHLEDWIQDTQKTIK